MGTSVASKRLFQEYRALSVDPPEGITAGPVNEDDLFLWECLILGPEGTPFAGGVFPAELKFPRDYPLMPPTMKFTSDIFHPNGALQPPPRRGVYADEDKSTPTAQSAYRSYTPPATTRTTTSMRASGGAPYRAWRRSSSVS